MERRGFVGDTHTRVGNRLINVLESKYWHFKGMTDNYGKPMFKSKFALMRHVCSLVTPTNPNRTPMVVRKEVRRSYDPQRLEMANAIGAQIFLHIGLGAPTADEVLKSLDYYETFIKDEQ